MDELAGLLCRERLLLEQLLFKLVTLRALLVGGEARFLTWAADEVESATERARQAELHRSIVVGRMAADRGLDADSLSLRALTQDSSEPWRTIFTEHRDALIGLTNEISDLMSASRRLATVGAEAVTETLDRLAGGAPESEFAGAGTYGPGATWEDVVPAPRMSRTL